MQIAPYLMFNGNAADAIQFYTQALGAQTHMLQRFADAPGAGAPEDADRVMHATIQVGESVLMFSDSSGKQPVNMGNNVHLSLNFSDEVGIQKAFDALSDGATVTMPLQDTFWGARFGMLTDKFGVCWMFNWDKPGEKPEGH